MQDVAWSVAQAVLYSATLWETISFGQKDPDKQGSGAALLEMPRFVPDSTRPPLKVNDSYGWNAV